MPNKKVLIVDDEPDYCVEISKALKRNNIDSDHTTNAQSAIIESCYNKYDTIVTDQMLKKQHCGLDLIEAITLINPKIFSILISGHLDKNILNTKIADNLIEKPFKSSGILIAFLAV